MARVLGIFESLPSVGHGGGGVTAYAVLRSLQREGHAVAAFILPTAGRGASLSNEDADMALLADKGIPVLWPTITAPAQPFTDQAQLAAYVQSESLRLLKDAGRSFAADAAFAYHWPAAKAMVQAQLGVPTVGLVGDPYHLPTLVRRRFNARYASDEERAALNLSPAQEDAYMQQAVRDQVAILNGCDAAGAFAAHHAAMLAESGARCRYVRTPVPDPLKHGRPPVERPRRFKIMHIGHLRGIATLTGVELLARDMLPELSRRLTPDGFELHIVGGYHDTLPADLKQALTHPAVVFRGQISPPDAEFLSSHVLIVPTPVDLGIRVRILTAFSYGCPVVAHRANAQGIPELEHGVNCLLADDGETLARHCVALAEDEALRKRLEEGGRATFERCFSTATAGRDIVAMIGGLIAARQPAPSPSAPTPAPTPEAKAPATDPNLVALRENVAKVAQMCGLIAQAFAKVDRYRHVTPGRYVLVDLTIQGWHAVLTKLLLGKYFAYHYGAELCGLVHDEKSTLYSTRQIAEAFGCNKFVSLTDGAQAIANQPDFADRVRRLIAELPRDGEALRTAISNLRIEGLAVGDLIYDYYLRTNGAPTIETLNQDLQNLIIDGYARTLFAQDFLNRTEVVAMTSAHMVYTYMGIMARAVLSRNAPVTQDLSRNPIRLHKYTDFSECRQATGQFQIDEFQRVFAAERDTAVAFGRDYVERRIAGRQDLSYGDMQRGPFGADKKSYARHELCRALGWDPEKPVICVMGHIFFESPHSVPHALYNDYLEWMSATAALAAANPACNWLFKFHPNQRHYDGQCKPGPLFVPVDEVRRRVIAAAGGAGHVALCPEDLNTASLIGLAHAVVTQHGTCGYEFASFGIPVVCAGRPAYGGMGFTHEPPTRAAYERQLATIQELQPLSDEQRERAFTYIYMFVERSRVRSTLLPELNTTGFWAPQFDPSLLDGVIAQIDRYRPEDDPLYLAMRRMIRLGHSSLNLL